MLFLWAVNIIQEVEESFMKTNKKWWVQLAAKMGWLCLKALPTYRQVLLLEDPVDGEGLLPPDWSSFLCGEGMTRSLV